MDIQLSFTTQAVELSFASTEVTIAANCASAFSWLDSLPEYNSDDEAANDGLLVGQWYITGPTHDSSAAGILKKRTV